VHRYGAGVATDPDIEAAVAGVVAEALAPLAGARPDVLFVFASDAYGADAARAGPLAFDEAAPRALAGAVAVHGVIGTGRELDDGPAVSVLAAALPGADVEVFHALADLTRRVVLERLNRGPALMSELAEPFAMALPSFSQHLDVLEDCGLVRSSKEGRVRTYELQPKPLETAGHWMARQREMWERRLDQMDNYVKTLREKKR